MTLEEILDFTYKASTEGSDIQRPARTLIHWSMEKLRAGEANELRHFYESLDVSKLSLNVMSICLRQCFGWREHLPEWWTFKERAIESAKVRFPEKYERAFIGLLNTEERHSDPFGTNRAFDQFIGVHPSLHRDTR